jgi:hypothetical protein
MTSVYESIRCFVVPVQVTEYLDLSLLVRVHHLLLEEKHFGVDQWIRIGPPPVQVQTYQGSTRVTYDYTVHINHWNELDDIILEKRIVLAGLGETELV